MSNRVLRFARLSHLYFGLLIAPSLMFFSFTGALQMFNLHEQVQGSDYKPPTWLARMSQVHKNATSILGHRNPPQIAPQATGTVGDGSHHRHDGSAGESATTVQSPAQPAPVPAQQPSQTPKRLQHLPLKIFFEVVAVGLFWMSVTGLYMAYRYSNRNWLVTAWWVAGLIIPLILLKF